MERCGAMVNGDRCVAVMGLVWARVGCEHEHIVEGWLCRVCYARTSVATCMRCTSGVRAELVSEMDTA